MKPQDLYITICYIGVSIKDKNETKTNREEN
jgi:hypothetical protein